MRATPRSSRAASSADGASRIAPRPAPGRGYLGVAVSSAGGRVLRDVAEVDEDAGLVPDDPRVVPRHDLDELTRRALHLGPVVHLDDHPAGHHVAEVVGLAGFGACDRPDVFLPLPAGLERAAQHGLAVQLDYLCVPMRVKLARLVGRVEALGLDSSHGTLL